MRLSDENALINDRLKGKETLAGAIEMLGYTVKSEGSYLKFARRDEKSASCVINDDATWHDYGDASHGDWAALYSERKNCTFRDAVKEGLRRFGVVVDPGYTSEQLTPVPVAGFEKQLQQKKPISPGLLRFFEKEAMAHKARYTELCRRLMPFAAPGDLHRAQRWFDIGYDAKVDRLTFPVKNLAGEIVNLFKYTPYKGFEMWKYRILSGAVRFSPAPNPSSAGAFNSGLFDRQLKVKYLKGRQRTLYNLEILKFKPRVLYIAEGEKDSINATVARKAAVTQGGANMWKEAFTDELFEACIRYGIDPATLKIVIIQDHDQAGLLSTVRIYRSLIHRFPNVVMGCWKTPTAQWLRSALSDHFRGVESAFLKNALKGLTLDAEAKSPWNDVAVIDTDIEHFVAEKFDFTDYEMQRRTRS